jgi:hypothetical protein
MSYRSRSFYIEAHGCCGRKCIRIRSSWRIDQLDTNSLFAIRSIAVLQPIADAFRQRHEFFKGRIRQVREYADAVGGADNM